MFFTEKQCRQDNGSISHSHPFPTPPHSTMHSSLYVCNCHSSCSPGNAMQMDGRGWEADGGWVEGREVVQLTCCNVCMYFISTLPWRAASAAGYRTDRLELKLCIVIGIIIPPLQLLSVHRSSGFHARYLVMGLSHYSALVFTDTDVSIYLTYRLCEE